LSIALAWAEIIGADDIFIGVSAVDYSHYPDCRPEFINAFQELANVATRVGTQGNSILIQTPLINLSKAETIRLGLAVGVDYSMTVSCYRATPQGLACGTCDSCFLRKKGFKDAGVPDPSAYY
jgi:7-cyano-7-deazaguanine synthase